MTLLLSGKGGSQNTVMLVEDTEADVMTIPENGGKHPWLGLI